MPLPPAYWPLVAFTRPAAPRAEIWRSLSGLVLVAVLYWAILAGGLQLADRLLDETTLRHLLGALSRAASPAGVTMMLATFAALALAVAMVTRVLHGRPVATLFGTGALRDGLRVGLPLSGLAVLLLPLALLDPNVGRSTPVEVLFAWLPLALPLLLVQVAAEEMVFRGYLLQQIASRSASPAAWMMLPSVLFGALHYAPETYGPMAFWPMLWAAAFGCLAADLTARTGNLGAAIGFHLANNVSAMFLLGVYGELDGLNLYTLVINPRNPAELVPYMATDALAMLTAWLLARLALRV